MLKYIQKYRCNLWQQYKEAVVYKASFYTILTLATSCKELTHWKRLWYWEGLGTGGEGDDRGWDGWMASQTWWTWVWVNSRSWWWTGRPGVLRFMGSQRVGHDWVTELNWTDWVLTICQTILDIGGIAMNKTKSLPCWNLYSSGGERQWMKICMHNITSVIRLLS